MLLQKMSRVRQISCLSCRRISTVVNSEDEETKFSSFAEAGSEVFGHSASHALVISSRTLPTCHGPNYRSAPEDSTSQHRFAAASDVAGKDLPLCTQCWATWLGDQWKALQEEEHRVHVVQQLLVHDEKALEAAVLTLAPLPLTKKSTKVLELETSVAELSAELDSLIEDERQLALQFEDVVAKESRVTAGLNDVLAEDWQGRDLDEGLDARLKSSRDELDRLTKLTLPRIAFRIDIESNIANINGVRIGKHNDVPDTEVNAACGLLSHLVDYLARSLSIKPKKATLRPKGQASMIDVLTPKGVVQRTIDFHIKWQLFKFSTFPDACASFGSIVQELYEEMLSRLHCMNAVSDDDRWEANRLTSPRAFTRLEGSGGDLLQGQSLKPAFSLHGRGSDPSWNAAVKVLLRNCIWLIDGHALLSKA